MTQHNRIKEHLESGRPLTPLTALNEYGCFRLASVVNRLRAEGMTIRTIIRTKYSDDLMEVKHYAEYRMEGLCPITK